MKNKPYILLLVLMAISINTLQAQSRKQKGLLKLAQQEYKQLRFAYAIPVYKQYLLKQNKDSLALLQLANSYQKVNQYDSAVKYFDLAVKAGVKYNANMAEVHAMLGNYEKATSIYKQLIDSNKTKLADARFFGQSLKSARHLLVMVAQQPQLLVKAGPLLADSLKFNI